MIELTIPPHVPLRLRSLILDFNGTLAVDGKLIPGVRERLEILSQELEIHVLTADTFGSAAQEVQSLPIKLHVIPNHLQDRAKLDFINELGTDACVCIGNGNNDRLMLQEAVLGIAVVQQEGCAKTALQAADLVTTSILDALDLLQNPKRLTATLRA